MADRILVDLNDRWVLTGDNLQWMVSRRSGDTVQARRFIRSKKGLLQALNAKPRTDTLYVGPITEEARSFIARLPDTHEQWLNGDMSQEEGSSSGSPGRDATKTADTQRAPTNVPEPAKGEVVVATRGQGGGEIAATADRGEEGGSPASLNQVDEVQPQAVLQEASLDDQQSPDPIPGSDAVEEYRPVVDLHVASARFKDGMVIIPFAELQHDNGYRLRQVKIRPRELGAKPEEIAEKTRAAWIKKKQADGMVVEDTDDIERFHTTK